MELKKITHYAFYTAAGFFFSYLLWYYFTGAGGPSLLAVSMVPAAFVVFTLDALRKNQLYPKLGKAANFGIAGIYILLCAAAAVYLTLEFNSIRMVRLYNWDFLDYLIGTVMFLLVMEFSRKKFFPLFILNIALILYVVYGWLVPGLFGHAGLSWSRVLTSMSLEMTTGVFSSLPQLALTLIGSFILVLSVLQAFGCIDSLLKGAKRIGSRSRYILPQSAVLGSMGVAAVSGSGAANAATTGSATIPTMIQAGVSRLRAATIETASSIGGQLMPPIMGISAFIMADFLGTSYFDVVARGFAPALIYFIGVSTTVYLISAKEFGGDTSLPIKAKPLNRYDVINLFAYLLIILGLVYLMGVKFTSPMVAAQNVFLISFIILFLINIWRKIQETSGPYKEKLKKMGTPISDFIEHFSTMTSEITLLLAILAVLTTAFVITGVPTKIGNLLMRFAGVNIAVIAVIAFFFGYVVGLGLPPSSTYIITGIVIAPQMIKAGINPWAAHFYAFFLGVFSELSPPTSVTAAVASKIANTDFNRTMINAIGLCLPLLTLMASIFARPELVIEPGAAQAGAFALVLMGTLGLMFCIHAKYSVNKASNAVIRLVLAGLSLVALFHPNLRVAFTAVGPIAVLIGYGIYKTRQRTGAASKA
ncbi:MAG: TRAP transporter permease [Spirochaetota bacterium]